MSTTADTELVIGTLCATATFALRTISSLFTEEATR
jgi:hypothetical protein